ncbi:CD3072 family TudS-related putative desulfidase [Miniphocaeibacter massiliensis]|uniref:CD3072 family TudS-related putative desulfidase n=1 Tax=Miniphocaeibacter massiliensis TaxID=2041841 RepID=UPI000C1C4347|nr:CD3072 family TudS-related putative desulfidase [Miniphocaeibacter massiliensis]
MRKKIILLSHCILNQSSVINDWERAKGAFPISKFIIEKEIGIIQLPCPEFLYLGINRPPMDYDDYDKIPDYRNFCNSILITIIKQIKSYIDNGYDFLGVIGINESPNCSISGKRGVFMEEYFKLCKEYSINTDYSEIPTWYNEGSKDESLENLIKFIERR